MTKPEPPRETPDKNPQNYGMLHRPDAPLICPTCRQVKPIHHSACDAPAPTPEPRPDWPKSESNSVTYNEIGPEDLEQCPTCHGYHIGGCHRVGTPEPPDTENRINNSYAKKRIETLSAPEPEGYYTRNNEWVQTKYPSKGETPSELSSLDWRTSQGIPDTRKYSGTELDKLLEAFAEVKLDRK